MKIKLLEEEDEPTMTPPIKAERNFSCFDESRGTNWLGHEEAVVSLSKGQAEVLCDFLNRELHGMILKMIEE